MSSPKSLLVAEITRKSTLMLLRPPTRSKVYSWRKRMLVREERRFRVDEIEYGGTWPFANKGKLSDVVNDAIAESQMPQ